MHTRSYTEGKNTIKVIVAKSNYISLSWSSSVNPLLDLSVYDHIDVVYELQRAAYAPPKPKQKQKTDADKATNATSAAVEWGQSENTKEAKPGMV
jgi:hypothetical protein